ncbi:hypothetical protein M422DRAFT_35154 [Sphaerobolus stellatus SS14]|uniref:DUF6699 domain-containing protein n=1 Tax=Sphaerobolus stellatus (strain SS14) TaxID=990650 RepID=A0A0C9UHJ6_SPHS4|nr:hypothetical protein M422DRAFT_35154 [Sphaerobolus stellatus SS14]
MANQSQSYRVPPLSTVLPVAPRRFTRSLPTSDLSDAVFLQRASYRLPLSLPDGLLWLIWQEVMPPTPRMPYIPLPDIQSITHTRRGRRSNTEQPGLPTIHPFFQAALSYDLRQHPSTAAPLLLFSVSALQLNDEQFVLSSIPSPFDAPATHPPLSNLMIDVGPHRDILITALHRDFVTCGDVLYQLHEYLWQPLQDWEDPDIDRRQLQETYNQRILDKETHDVVRNIDALSGQTMFYSMTAGNLSGIRWILRTVSQQT